jgi:hypothetical protein
MNMNKGGAWVGLSYIHTNLQPDQFQFDLYISGPSFI